MLVPTTVLIVQFDLKKYNSQKANILTHDVFCDNIISHSDYQFGAALEEMKRRVVRLKREPIKLSTKENNFKANLQEILKVIHSACWTAPYELLCLTCFFIMESLLWKD